jgi:hypothetical protein
MAETKEIGGRLVVDYSARDYDSLLRSLRARIPETMPEWTDFESDADFGNVVLQLFAHMGDLLNYYVDRVATESFLGTAQTRHSVIQHLGLIGYRMATAAPAATNLTLSFPAATLETVIVRRGDAFASKSGKGIRSVRFEFNAEQPLEIDCSTLAVTNGRKLFSGVRVEEGHLVEDELLGTSDGTPNQRFRLAHPRPILRPIGQRQATARDLIVRTTLGAIVTEWTLQESLAFSRSDSTDIALEIDDNDRASVLMGDGEFGAVPPSGAEVRATYRVGGGTLGNLPADAIQTIVDAPQLSMLAAEISNRLPATGGSEREDIAHAVMHAPAVFRSLKRAVTAADYEALALMFSGVGKVRAGRGSWNLVTLFVAPEGGGQVSDVLRSSLLSYFEDLRPVSTLVEIADVDYVEIAVTAEVAVLSYYSQSQVVEEVRDAGGRLLAFASVDFGTPVYLSKFYEAIEAVEGVDFVNISEFRRGDQPPGSLDASGKLNLAEHELAMGAAAPGYDGRIRVIASGGF